MLRQPFRRHFSNDLVNMAWEDTLKEALIVVFTVGLTLFLIVVAWMIMWHFFLSKIRFLREIISPDSNGSKMEAKGKNRKERCQRKDL